MTTPPESTKETDFTPSDDGAICGNWHDHDDSEADTRNELRAELRNHFGIEEAQT